MTPGPKQKESRRKARQNASAPAAPAEVEATPLPASTANKKSDDSAVGSSRRPEPAVTTSVAAPLEPTCDPQFKKRSITSNWGRYEDSVQAETDFSRKRGEDFELLLSTSVGSSAHFRFKEQQDWQDDLHIDQFLSVDCDELADALQTIPLHTRLQLPQEIFPPEILRQYDDDAASHRQKRGGARMHRWKDAKSVGDALTNTLLAASRPPKVMGRAELSKSLGECLLLHSGERVLGEPRGRGEVEEEDIDVLLSLSNAAKPQGELDDRNERKGSTEPSNQAMAPVDHTSTVEPVAEGAQKPTIDLEDWLDSVLQD
ncbi:unnamed protein product [Ixodes hexagonus]